MPEMLIGGEWRQGAAHEEIEVVNPASEDVVDSVPSGAPEDVELAVATAKRDGGAMICQLPTVRPADAQRIN